MYYNVSIDVYILDDVSIKLIEWLYKDSFTVQQILTRYALLNKLIS